MRIVKFCKCYLLKEKITYIIFIILSILMTGIGIYLSILTGNFLDSLIGGKNTQCLVRYCSLFAFISIINFLLNVVAGYLGVKIQTRLGFTLNMDILNYLKRVSISYTKNVDVMYLNERINNDANEVITFTINVIVQIAINVSIVLFSGFFLLKINYKIASILFILVIAYLIVYHVFKKKMYNNIKSVKEAQAIFFSRLSEHISFLQFIKGHSLRAVFDNRIQHSFQTTLSKILAFQRLRAMFISCDSMVSTIAMILLYFIGGLEILHGNLTIGGFTIITSLFNSMVSSAKYFLELGQNYQNTLVSYNRIMELLELPEQKNGEKKLYEISTIELKNLSFQYGERKIFENFSYTFCKGNIYCLFGANGIGKSTLIELILGLYLDEYEGDILVNGEEIHQIDMENLRGEHIGVCEQFPILISDTIENNINMESHNNSKDIDAFEEAIGIKEFVNKLPAGYKTLINIQSNNISGGEKQKISIARVIKKNPDVIIFDEPTSAMDYESTMHFYQELERLKKDKIVIIITHDLSYVNDSVITLSFDNL